MIAGLQDSTVFSDPATLFAVALVVFLIGLSKGGLGGALALMGVPILSLVMSPVQAAALLLPTLLMMDAISLWVWRGWYDRATLLHLLPGALLGIAIGWATAAFTSETVVRLMVGLLAVGFVARAGLARQPATPRGQSRLRGAVWGAGAGFTSFVAHAGGPPYQVYVVPLRFDPKVYTGTSVIFFAVTNVVKLGPYAALGQFDSRTLVSALVMLPLAALATVLGARVVTRLRPSVFYPFIYTMVGLVGAKLVWDAMHELLG